MLFLCVFPAHAQTQNDDRYGFEPVPAAGGMPQQPPVAAPTMPVQQQPLTPVYPQAQQNYAPPAPSFAQNFQPPQASAPPPGYAPASSGFAPAPLQPYGYVAPRPDPLAVPQSNGTYLTAADSRYGTQMAAAPNAYYASTGGSGGNFNGYTLGPGDKLHVSVFGEEDLTGDYQIDSSGMVRLPLIGTLRAAGYTAPALESAIAGALAQGYLKSPRVNVEVSTYRPFYIIGAVNRPGEYPYVANMSALNAVAFGGGFTDQARQSTVSVRHEGSTVEEEVPASQLTRIYPGDVVKVKNTVFWDAMSVFSPLAGPAVLAAAALK